MTAYPLRRRAAAALRGDGPGRRTRLLGTLAAVGLVLLNVIVATGCPDTLRAAVGFPVIVVVPGALALRALGVTGRTGWDWLLHVVALSLAGLLAVGLTLGLLPGAALSPLGCLVGVDLLAAALAVAAARAGGRTAIGPVRAPAGGPPRAGGWLAAGTVVSGAGAVALAAAGAHRLNAGGGSGLTMAAFGLAAAALGAAALTARRGWTTAAATGVYLVALTVLLATSLRGVGVTGHDIKIEYRVLLDTLETGSWRPGGTFVGYNSCLSITVLPALLSRLLGVAAIDAYRICFQILFATVPVAVFLLGRRLLPSALAVCGAGFFIAFPAFVNDMPMLNRQEIALIFFVVAVAGLLDVRGSRRQRAVMFGVAAAGLTVSHYTSTYLTVVLLLVAWAMAALRRPLGRRRPGPRPSPRQGHRLSPGLSAVILVAMAVSWAVVSGSAATFGNGLYAAAVAVRDRAAVSADATRYSLVAGVEVPTDAAALAGYLDAVRRADPVPAGTAPAPPATDCTPNLLAADTLARTAAGGALAGAGMAPERLNAASRGAAVLLFEGGSVIGCALLWWRRRRASAEVLVHLAGGSLVLLAGAVAAPQLSDSYGLLRLYQQLLVLLAPLIVLALVVPVRLITGRARPGRRPHRQPTAIVIAVAVGCLLTMTGLAPQLTGGYPPQLALNNAGPYFHAYYADGGDLREAAWIRANLPAGSYVVADSRETANLRSMTHLYPQEGVVPDATPPDAYVSLTMTGPDSAVAVAVVGERVLRYAFGVSCVAAGRRLVYRTARHRLYGPVVAR